MDPGNLGLSLVQRRWIGIPEPGSVVTVEHLPDPPHSEAPTLIAAMEIEIDFLHKGYTDGKEYLSTDMASLFIDRFRGIVVTVGRPILFEFHGEELQGKIKSLTFREASSVPARNDTHTGVIFAGTDVKFTAATDATIKIQPYDRFPVAASTFAAGVQTINIYGGNFNILSSTCPCAAAERCLATSKKDEVKFETVPSLASDSTTGNSKYITFILNVYIPYIMST